MGKSRKIQPAPWATPAGLRAEQPLGVRPPIDLSAAESPPGTAPRARVRTFCRHCTNLAFTAVTPISQVGERAFGVDGSVC